MIALLVLRPGPLRDGLNALLSTMPEIRLVAQAEDADAALDFVAGRCVELVIFKSDETNVQLIEIAGKMKALCPQIQLVVLIEDEAGRQIAEAGGADLVVMPGIRPSRLKEEIEGLINSLAAEP